MRKISLQILFYILILALWQGIFSLKIWPEYLLPSPLKVFQALWNGLIDKSFLIGVGMSLKRIVIGYTLSVIGGVTLGFLIAKIQLVDKSLGSFALGLHSLPSICWLPVGLLWFGPSEGTILIIIILGSLFSISITTNDGIKNSSPVYERAARTMGSKGFRLYWDVVIPAVLPNIISGLKQGWLFAWRALMATELFLGSLGLGHLLQKGRELNDVTQIFAVMIVIVLIGLMVDSLLFGRVEKRIRAQWGFTPNQ